MFSDILNEVEKKNRADAARDGYVLKKRPPVDIFETETEIVLLVEMPGVEKRDMEVQVKDDLLYISGKRQNEEVHTDYILRETRDLMYERVFELEEDIDRNKVTANYKAGILKISLGKKEKVKPRTIEIK